MDKFDLKWCKKQRCIENLLNKNHIPDLSTFYSNPYNVKVLFEWIHDK